MPRRTRLIDPTGRRPEPPRQPVGAAFALALSVLVGAGCQALGPVTPGPSSTQEPRGFEPPAVVWETLPSLPVAVAAPAASPVGHGVVLTGGIAALGRSVEAVQVLDPDSGSWTTPVRLAQPRFSHAQVTLADGRILVTGGQHRELLGQTRALMSTELIDPATWTVTPGPALPGAMATPWAGVLPGGEPVVVGSAWLAVYDAKADAWTRVVELLEPRVEHTAAVLPGGSVLVIGGRGLRSLERVDPAAGRSIRLAVVLPEPIDDAAAWVLPDGRVWLLGGQNSQTGETLDTTWLIDPAGDGELAPGPPLRSERGVADHRLVLVPGGFVVAGGESQHRGRDTELTSAWLADPARRTLTPLKPMPRPHDDAAAVTLPGGEAVLLGGTVTTHLPGGVAMPQPSDAVTRLSPPPGR